MARRGWMRGLSRVAVGDATVNAKEEHFVPQKTQIERASGVGLFALKAIVSP